MKNRKTLMIMAGMSACVLLALGAAAWWVRRDPEPTTAMESVISYWERWSEDVVRDRVNGFLQSTSSPSLEEMQGAAEAMGGSQAIALYKRAIQSAPQTPSLRFGLISKYCTSTEEVTEVILTAGSQSRVDPVKENLSAIQEELSEAEKADPSNSSVDYLKAYLAMVYGSATPREIFEVLDRSKDKSAFDDYSLEAARRNAELLVRIGFPEREAKFSVVQRCADPFHPLWFQLGERLESLASKCELEGDQPSAERTFLYLVRFGERLSAMKGHLQGSLTGLNLQSRAFKALGELCSDEKRLDEAKSYREKVDTISKSYGKLQPFQYEIWHKVEAMGDEDFTSYLNAFLSEGAQAAVKVLSKG
jgi:tetratricopeptide (TPR) repeat protein